MTAEELVARIQHEGCYVFGTGFVATLLDEAFASAGVTDCVKGYLATTPTGEHFKGQALRAVDDPAIDRTALVCIAVHEANLHGVEDLLDHAGYSNTAWVYPLLYDLIYGEPLYHDVGLPLDMILEHQDPSWNWLAVRALAAQGIRDGSGAGREAYIAAQALHSSAETAEKRYEMLRGLVANMLEQGFDARHPVLVDTNLNIIDGLHRVATAWVLGIERIPCTIVRASDAFDKLLTEKNKLTAEQLGQAGLDDGQRAAIEAVRAQMTPSAPKPEITFILPAYNVADYIDQCMESVVAQTFEDFEALLIDDGSTDGTSEKCDEWASRDTRIRAIHKPNSGVSPSRNLGIELARGTYLAFVDPDDWLDTRYLEVLHDAAIREDALLSECDLWRYDNRTGKKIRRFCGQSMGVRHTTAIHMKYGPTASYKSISKRCLWIDNNVRFPDIAFESPAIFALVVALAGERWAYVPEPLYYYRRFRPESLVETAYAKAPGVADNTLGVAAMEHLCNEFKRHGLYELYADALPGIAAFRLNDILAMQYHRRSAEDFAELVANQRRYLEGEFPQLPRGAYITWGGYNLNKILQHLPMLNDPSCRFNFSSIAAIAFKGNGGSGTVHHPNRYREMMLTRELDQVFWRVLDEQHPQLIFMDLVDDRFDLVECNGRYLTASDAFEGASFEGVEPGRRIRFGTDEHLAVWRRAFDRFAQLLCERAPQARLVIVESYLAERVGTLGRTREFEGAGEIFEINRVLKRLYAHARSAAPGAITVQAYAYGDYFTDEAYEYGAVPQHLNDIVNQRISERIEEAIL